MHGCTQVGVILLLSSLVSITFSIFQIPSMLRLCGPVHFLRTMRRQGIVLAVLVVICGIGVLVLWLLAECVACAINQFTDSPSVCLSIQSMDFSSCIGIVLSAAKASDVVCQHGAYYLLFVVCVCLCVCVCVCDPRYADIRVVGPSGTYIF